MPSYTDFVNPRNYVRMGQVARPNDPMVVRKVLANASGEIFSPFDWAQAIYRTSGGGGPSVHLKKESR
ncbi:hypothetical protein GCM10010987_79810 [Bradyrhizobium guangdongense]|uniref:Uncharacterized protein n=2 Tax=Bradyrhizobium TaxID=374 RepID=A0AA88BD02_9BRAD|nr:hypothetical protein XH86_37700 [Bradyrhizobium guangdongense]RXH04017.1 hypothetical protein EAS56_37580 [Bradyrhizobium guangzhouense]GGI34525.1 hypothetical protein GCM10010987_79810 [Bradyrhizobium guangdongense]